MNLAESRKWKEGSHELFKQEIISFMGGSKNAKGVGAGAWRRGSEQEIVCSVEPFATVCR